MAHSEDYQTYVLDDIERYKGLCRPVRSSLPARLLIRRLSLKKLHPNPEDEFSDPAIGPNEGIVSNYIAEFRKNLEKGDRAVSEKLIVEKMSTGGYMLLNGHHRWMAAIKLHLPSVPVSVVNTISEEAIRARLDRSSRERCVSFDLDEVLLRDSGSPQADPRMPLPFRFFIRQRLRRNAGELIGELQRLGFDVWLYSGSAMSEEDVTRLLGIYHAQVDGLVHCVKGNGTSASLKQAFRAKYKLSLHVSNTDLTWVDTHTKQYDTLPISEGDSWAADAFAHIRRLVPESEASD